MKKMITSLVLSLSALLPVNAMSYEQAREEARFLTDKMAYELNLNEQQYNDAFEINLDYLLSVRDERDLYGDYLTYRNADLRHILYDWQYSLFMAADYFFRPLTWLSGAWYLPVYRYYRVGHYYYNHPSVFYSYRGGHGRYYHHTGFYISRRPHWNGGYRGHNRGPVSHHGNVHHGGHPSHRGGGYQSPNRGAGSHVSGRPSYHDSRSHGNSGYGHPSSTRSTVGHSTGHSRSGSFSGGSHSGSSHNIGSHSSGSHSVGSRSSSFGGGHTRSGSFSGSSHSGGPRGGGSHSGSSRGGGRGR